MGKRLRQGVHCFIDATDIRDANGAVLDVTGWVVDAVARASHARGTIVATWHTTPVGSQGAVIAGGVGTTDRVRLVVTPTQTTAWTVPLVVIQAELTSPAGQVSRIVDETYEVAFEAVL